MEALHTMQPVADYAAPSFVSAIIDNPATAAATAFDANCRDWKEDVGREGDKKRKNVASSQRYDFSSTHSHTTFNWEICRL